MLTKAFLLATLERAVKTFAQGLAALLVADGTDLLTTNWGDRLSVAGMAAVVSVLTSVASGAVGQPGPSLANAETLNPAAPEPAVAVPESDIAAGMVEGVGDIADGILPKPGDDGPKPQGGYWGGV
jgi:hypothetical protein